MTKPIMWCFYDPTKKMKTDNLTSEEAQLVIMRMKTKNIQNFLVWRSDWPTWKKLSDFIRSEGSAYMAMSSLISKGEVFNDTKAFNLKMSLVDAETQYEIENNIPKFKIEVVLQKKNGQFYRSLVQDVSKKHLKLRTEVPLDFVAEYVEIVFLDKEDTHAKKIKFFGLCNNKTDIEFRLKTETELDNLEQLLKTINQRISQKKAS